MQPAEIENIELGLLFDAIYQRYGYDFRQYARASIKRRIKQIMGQAGTATITGLADRILHDEAFFQEVAGKISVMVTEMFRDPHFYLALRREVLPYLKTYPFIKAWVAGCATGEEVYSLAVVLFEEGLFDRTTIYATDMNEVALDTAGNGIYPLSRMQGYTGNYLVAGGKHSFSDYYYARYDSAVLDGRLKKNITFARHNLAQDQVFSEMHLIFCRNVLIYFQPDLQRRVIDLCYESLIHDGFLCMGLQERMLVEQTVGRFAVFLPQFKIYRKLSGRPEG